MRLAYFDCFAGASGDMILGALIDAGLPIDDLRRALGTLNLGGYTINAVPVMRGALSGTHFSVEVSGHHHHRTLADITTIIDGGGLSVSVKERARAVFTALAAAEARVHRCPVEEVHFHEIGAVDSIIDIVGAMAALELMDIDEVRSSPLPLGSGTAQTMHGLVPVPAPATLELLRGIPVTGEGEGEATTPTGAALVAHLAKDFGPLPAMAVRAVGYGAGTRNTARPNLLRVVIGDSDGADSTDRVTVMETAIDDMNPEIYEYVCQRLFAEGALDVYLVPVIMKKSRPAAVLTVVAPAERVGALSGIIFAETTTAGLRTVSMERRILPRETISAQTPWGSVRVKVLTSAGAAVTRSPEYEDCRRIAAEQGVPLKDVYQAALDALKP